VFSPDDSSKVATLLRDRYGEQCFPLHIYLFSSQPPSSPTFIYLFIYLCIKCTILHVCRLSWALCRPLWVRDALCGVLRPVAEFLGQDKTSIDGQCLLQVIATLFALLKREKHVKLVETVIAEALEVSAGLNLDQGTSSIVDAFLEELDPNKHEKLRGLSDIRINTSDGRHVYLHLLVLRLRKMNGGN
jgi:hypothetical protein